MWEPDRVCIRQDVAKPDRICLRKVFPKIAKKEKEKEKEKEYSELKKIQAPDPARQKSTLYFRKVGMLISAEITIYEREQGSFKNFITIYFREIKCCLVEIMNISRVEGIFHRLKF